METAALFDLDGTLYTGHAWRDLTTHHWQAKRHRRWVMAYVARNMALLPLYRTGMMSQEAFYEAWTETMPWLIRGWKVEDAGRLFETLTGEQIMPHLRSDVVEHLRRHQEEGHLVALVSGMFAPWLETVARRLAVPHAIGTLLEVRKGKFTGRPVSPLCQGEGKPERVHAYLSELGVEIDWQMSFAYADRFTDLPLLRQVGRPVAVYPDETLHAEARLQGWPVVGEVAA